MSCGPHKPAEGHSLDLTALLNRMRDGDREAGDGAVELVYGELHRIASREMRRERDEHTLQTTALINEAYLRLIGAESLEFIRIACAGDTEVLERINRFVNNAHRASAEFPDDNVSSNLFRRFCSFGASALGSTEIVEPKNGSRYFGLNREVVDTVQE